MATTLNSTTLSGAITASQTNLPVASTTNMSAPTGGISQQIYVIGPGQPRGELMTVTAVSSSTQVQVSRLDEYKAFWPSGSLVLIGPTPVVGANFIGNVRGGFQTYNPPGASASNNSSSSSAVQITPWVNVITGEQWLFSSVLNCWVPGWNNVNPPAVTATVASQAGATTVSGPLFHVSGTNAITSWTLPTGFTAGSFTVIPDAAFTWTNAGNIGGAGGTAVAGKSLTFTYDTNAAKWYPSYIA